MLPGTVSAGIVSGARIKRTPSTKRMAAVPCVAVRRDGSNFSTAMSPATTAIQTMLITPSAKSDAINAQQQPIHDAPCLAPIWSAPESPLRQEPSKKPSGLRHLPRQTSLSGVSSYTAATIRVAPATQRPARSHASRSPEMRPPWLATTNATTPILVHAAR